jgi:CheY-like chemotaxis protein
VLRCLEDQGVRDRVLHVEDGEQALAVLEGVKANTVTRPKLVLLDLRLPRVDGIQVLRHVRRTPELSNIPVVVFTTSTGARDIENAYANFVNSYLVKPEDITELNALLRGLSIYWRDHNRPLAPPAS